MILEESYLIDLIYLKKAGTVKQSAFMKVNTVPVDCFLNSAHNWDVSSQTALIGSNGMNKTPYFWFLLYYRIV